MIIKHPSHLNLTHSYKSMLSPHFVITSLQKAEILPSNGLKASDKSSYFSDLAQRYSESTSFTNIFLSDQTPNSYIVLLVFCVYIKWFGLTKLIPISTVVLIHLVSIQTSYKIAPSKKGSCSIFNDRISCKLFKNTHLDTNRMYSPVTT